MSISHQCVDESDCCYVVPMSHNVESLELAVVRVAVRRGVATLTIDNPPLNLLDAPLIRDLRQVVDALRDDQGIRVLVVQSADPEFFIAHGDANFVTDMELVAELSEGITGDLNGMQVLHESLRQLPQVTIAKIAGFARGGGHELAMALDMRFAAIGKAFVAQPETLLGIMPGGGGTQYLTRLTGRARALEAILGGALFDAEQAERYGLVNRALPADELDDFVDDLALRIAGLSPAVIAAATAATDAALGTTPIEEALAIENRHLMSLFTAEAVERTVSLLARGYQTRDGEKRLEDLLTTSE